MPIFLEPNIGFDVVLDADMGKPVDTRPTFVAKSQSMRGQQRILRMLDRLNTDTSVTSDQLFDDIVDVLGDVLCGWRNMSGIEFAKDRIADVLSYTEARELCRKVAYNQRIDDLEKKSSE